MKLSESQCQGKRLDQSDRKHSSLKCEHYKKIRGLICRWANKQGAAYSRGLQVHTSIQFLVTGDNETYDMTDGTLQPLKRTLNRKAVIYGWLEFAFNTKLHDSAYCCAENQTGDS